MIEYTGFIIVAIFAVLVALSTQGKGRNRKKG